MFLLLSSVGWASPNYPGELQVLSAGDCLPACTVCHATAGGGTGTVIHEFGLAMMDAGMTGAGDTATVDTAWESLATNAVDSDGDGTPDVDELAAGDDPNPDGVTFCDTITPTYGCFNTSALPASALGALAGLLVLRRRKS